MSPSFFRRISPVTSRMMIASAGSAATASSPAPNHPSIAERANRSSMSRVIAEAGPQADERAEGGDEEPGPAKAAHDPAAFGRGALQFCFGGVLLPIDLGHGKARRRAVAVAAAWPPREASSLKACGLRAPAVTSAGLRSETRERDRAWCAESSARGPPGQRP